MNLFYQNNKILSPFLLESENHAATENLAKNIYCAVILGSCKDDEFKIK